MKFLLFILVVKENFGIRLFFILILGRKYFVIILCFLLDSISKGKLVFSDGLYCIY